NDPERGGGEDDRDEQRRLCETCGVEHQRHDEGEAEGRRVTRRRERQRTSAQLVELDFETSEKEQEGEAYRRQDLYCLVDLHPPEDRGPEHDPRENLQHHRRELEGRNEPERERRSKCGRHDDQEICEVHLHLGFRCTFPLGRYKAARVTRGGSTETDMT